MSVYSIKGKGWRYDFTLRGVRYTNAWFKTKKAALKAEAQKKEAILTPKFKAEAMSQAPTDMAFLDLVNQRLDFIKAYRTEHYYVDHVYIARKWIKKWGMLNCSQISSAMIQRHIIQVGKKVSAHSANKELRFLRAVFNYGKHPSRNLLEFNPTDGIEFLPIEKRVKYVPPKEDVLKVIMAADPATKDYLWTIALTMGRVGEINRLIWDDVYLDERYIILYTRKKRGGHLTPRKIPMPEKLHEILSRRFEKRDKTKQWVFWHRLWDKKKAKWVEVPYTDRKTIMSTLCKKAGVKYFRFHALRHFGASLLDRANVPIGSIQRILGHENRSTTEIYLHSIDSVDRVAMEVLNAEMENFSHTDSHTKKRKGLR